MTAYEILGIGSPILDYILPVEEHFLKQVAGKKGGMEPIDYFTFQEILNNSPEQPTIVAGGSCSNTLKGLARLGFRCGLMGVIGSDEAAKQYLSLISQYSVVPLFQTSELKTSRVICFVTPDGERTCRSFLGASQDIQLDKISSDLFKAVKIVHIEGYSLLQNLLPEKMMQLAKESGALISFDLASFELVEQFKERILYLLSHFVDIAFANESEIQTLTGVGGKKGCEYLKDLSGIAVVKQSSQGAWIGKNGTLIYQPALEVQAVDSTGAGDLFASGFLAAYLKGKSLEECASLGSRLGAAAVQVQGTEIPPEQWEQLQPYLHP